VAILAGSGLDPGAAERMASATPRAFLDAGLRAA
jgi:hypothetical protein